MHMVINHVSINKVRKASQTESSELAKVSILREIAAYKYPKQVSIPFTEGVPVTTKTSI